jgi:hypothetical protein
LGLPGRSLREGKEKKERGDQKKNTLETTKGVGGFPA